MSLEIEFQANRASAQQIFKHLSCCDADFVPILSSRVEIGKYAQKIVCNATRIEAWSRSKLIGLIAVYCNDQKGRIAYITSVSVIRTWAGRGVGTLLMNQCVERAKASGMQRVTLQVDEENVQAIRFYKKIGFTVCKGAPKITMSLNL